MIETILVVAVLWVVLRWAIRIWRRHATLATLSRRQIANDRKWQARQDAKR